MSIVSSITVVDDSNLSIITVGTQGASGPNTILSKSVNSITLAASDEGGVLIYDNGNNHWTVSSQNSSPTVKVRELVFNAGGSTVSQIYDEDNMASNSASGLATQQSIKAYVDAEIGNVDTLNVSDGSSSIAITLASETLGLKAGTGVAVAYSGNDVTYSNGQALSTTSKVTYNNVDVSGTLTVSGTTTTIDTATLAVSDNKITLNKDATGTPSEDAGLEVERGDSTNVVFAWIESTDRWTADNPLQATEYYVGSTKIVDSSGVWQGPSTCLKGLKG